MSIVFRDQRLALHLGDCLEVLPTVAEASVDAIVTDPPYGIGFMGQQWDQPGTYGSTRSDGQKSKRRGHRNVAGDYLEERALAAGTYDQSPESRHRFEAWCAAWGAELLRVAKPGAWLLSFGSPRSHHRLAVGLEDAGWELTDEIAWLFAQGMPKDRTTLKPAHEPIVMARKPARRVTPLQIDETRIPFAGTADEAEAKDKNRHADFGTTPGQNAVFGDFSMVPSHNYDAEGRWPANVALTDPVLDPGVEGVVLGRKQTATGHVPASRPASAFQASAQPETGAERRLDAGSYNRYFLIPKAGRAERNAGVDLDERPLLWSSATAPPGSFQSAGTKRAARNHHPTVKPLELMQHLVRLVTPRGGVVLDPFVGSGSTAIAALAAGRRCIGIDRDPEYLDIARRRLQLLRGEDMAEVPA